MSRANHNGSDPLGRWSGFGLETTSTSTRALRPATASVALHVVGFAIFLVLPDTEFRYLNQRALRLDLSRAVPLVAPRLQDLTQKDPNKGKVTQELDVSSKLPQAPSPRAFRPPAPSGPADLPAPVLGPAPQIEIVEAPPEIVTASAIPSVARPVEQPKIALENVAPPTDFKTPENPLIRSPRVSVDEAARTASGGGPGGASSDGKSGEPASAGNMQLMSDPLGVDFKPYMLQVLTAVRQNWFRVIPAIARTGRPGLVQVQFIIDKGGGVTKVVIAASSGTLAFDRAAVASISASYPFAPLPAEFRGTEIRLQLAFSYNISPRR